MQKQGEILHFVSSAIPGCLQKKKWPEAEELGRQLLPQEPGVPWMPGGSCPDRPVL